MNKYCFLLSKNAFTFVFKMDKVFIINLIQFCTMTIKYRVLERRNPSDLDLPAKFYAKAVTHEVIGIDELCELIADQSTVSETDVLAVLNSLEKNVIRQIKKGNLIQLGRLGSFQLSLKSAGSDLATDVTASNVLRKRIIFRPSKRMRNALATVDFTKVE